MTLGDGYTAVDVRDDRAADMFAVAGWAFVFTVKDEDLPKVVPTVPWDRARGVDSSDGTLVAFHSSCPYPLRVPGGSDVPASGLTYVGVHQGHRRRGLLTSMIGEHFARSLARGEVVSTLYASEPEIYQRFGYGLACPTLSLTLGRGPSLREVAGASDLRVDLADADRTLHEDAVLSVLRREGRPGTEMDICSAILADLFLDVESWRNGAERKRFALVSDEHGPAAFATFARKSKWEDSGPAGTTSVFQWAAATAAATSRLFSVLGDLDLTSEMSVENVAPDHPLVHLLVDPRAPKPRRSDNLWVRILDVPRALEGRGYAADADATVRITDAQVPANHGTWRIAIAGGRATVATSQGDPDFELSIQELSAAYLGGVTLTELAGAGLVTGDGGAIRAASNALRGDFAPASAINF